DSIGSQFWSHVTLREGSGQGSDTLHADIRLLDDAGRVLAEVSGVRCLRLERTAAQEERKIGDWLYEVAWQPAADAVGEDGEPDVTGGLWLLLTDSAGVGARLRELLETRDEVCVSVSPGDDVAAVLARISERAPSALRVVHLWNLDLSSPGEGADFDWKASVDHGCISLLHLVQALVRNGWDQSARLWVVTRGAHAVDDQPTIAISQTPASGLAGVIAAEVPSLGCTRIDLDPEGGDGEAQRLLDELLRNAEPQIALRRSGRFVPRLVRSERDGSASETSPGAAKVLELPDAQAFRLAISPPYVFDNLSLRLLDRRRPGNGEVEIEVLAAGLNFRDVLKAMGLYPGLGDGEVRLGDECAGRVVAVGEGVARFRVGDEVLAIASNGFGSHVTVDVHFVVPKPAGVSFEDAATIPVAYSTAFYALHHVGRLQQGERVLIHAAAGGVGLAAISLAQSIGAEIFATAGSEGKREYLRSLGVQHVLDSRSLDWAQEVLRLTGGEGVDVILNSLAGEAIRAGLASLRPFGRFVEIGKIDIYENSQVGLYPFRNNVAFSAIDMEQLFVRRPELCQSILEELMARFRRGELRPLPHTVFPVTDAVGAFRYMAQRKNTGKIVLAFEQQVRSEGKDAGALVRAEGTYLITGGLGGLGLKVARHLVDIGARHLALIGRGEPSEEARAALVSMREAGADIHIGKVDVADDRQLAAFLSALPPNLPPLKGVVHAAGVLDDGIVMQLDEDRFYKVLRPKIAGAWNLHRATSGQPLDFFVLFSSIASVFSNPGQGNYVAANAFLDALAHYRRVRGLPAVSIDWGPWSEVGMASHLDPRRLEARGMGSISPAEGVRALEALIGNPSPQIAVLPISRARWERWSDARSIASLLALMADGSRPRTEEGRINRGTILSADASERQRLLEAYLCEAGGRVLGMATSKLDVEQPLNRMGVDSLMAVELKNRVEADLGVDLPVLKVLEGASMRHLASLLLERFGTATG
ncbi:MAG TPA: SDR family NAD(P)-dependent oxidoreductase, partial [Thermoanaerobaculia bacterium]|nr:SDR family NAD(P)-dependent oxidoreductase [Thermoanaerobaculia bacterium]